MPISWRCWSGPATASTLLIAPTGGGKTLAGFLPSLVELGGGAGRAGLHTLYVSPLKALAADIGRNLTTRRSTEMGLAIRVEDRTGDTKRGAAAAAAGRPAAHPADDAGVAGADAVLRGGAADLRGAVRG